MCRSMLLSEFLEENIKKDEKDDEEDVTSLMSKQAQAWKEHED